MTKATCSVPDCDEAAHAKRLCNRHYLRLRKTGDPLTPLSGSGRNRRSLGRLCSVEGCSDSHLARGFCNRHYKRFSATGNPLKTPTGVSQDHLGTCSVAGCSEGDKRKGLCLRHYARRLKWGDENYPVQSRIDSNRGREECSPPRRRTSRLWSLQEVPHM